MKIRISAANAQKIEAALSAVNGRAKGHTYTSYSEVEAVKKRADATLNNLLYKKDQAGAKFVSKSGDGVAQSYKYTRTGTELTLLRTSTDWYLVDVQQQPVYTSGGSEKLWLTRAQDAAAKAYIAQFYSVLTAN